MKLRDQMISAYAQLHALLSRTGQASTKAGEKLEKPLATAAPYAHMLFGILLGIGVAVMVRGHAWAVALFGSFPMLSNLYDIITTPEETRDAPATIGKTLHVLFFVACFVVTLAMLMLLDALR